MDRFGHHPLYNSHKSAEGFNDSLAFEFMAKSHINYHTALRLVFAIKNKPKETRKCNRAHMNHTKCV